MSSFGQKIGYIDTEYITSKMPEYQKAQEDIEKLTTKWVKEISEKNEEVAKLEKAYRAEEVLLTEEMRQQRLRTIADKDKEVKELQNRVFGLNGELFKKKQEIMRPILDQIVKATEKIVKLKRLDFIFDKASDSLVMIYTNPTHDYTDYVMEELGISVEQLKKKKKKNKTMPKRSQQETQKRKQTKKLINKSK
jgi:outer membrane protein